MEELKQKVGLGEAKRTIIFEIASHQNKYLPYTSKCFCSVIRLGFNFKFFLSSYFCHLHVNLLACFYEIPLKCLVSHIHLDFDDFKLWKQCQSSSQETMGQICYLETVQPQEIPIKVCVMFYNALSD